MAVYLRGSCNRKHHHDGACQTWYYHFTIRGVTYKRAIPEARNKRQAEQVERQARQAVFEGKYGRQAGTESFTKFVHETYLPWARANKRSWYHDTRHCVVICAFFKGKTFGDITPMLVEHFKKHRREGLTMRGTKRNMATVNRELAQLSKIFSLAVDNDYCQLNPCRKVRRFRVDNRRERVLTSAEEAELLTTLTGPAAALKPVLLLALNTGMRRGEMMDLCWADVDVDVAAKVINVPGAITKSGRTLPLNDTALAALSELKERAGTQARVLAGLACSKGTLSQRFSAAATAAGSAGVTLHTLRHTFATRLKDAGVDPFTVRDLLGHASIEMTEHYTHATADTMRRGVEKLPGAARVVTRIVPSRFAQSA